MNKILVKNNNVFDYPDGVIYVDNTLTFTSNGEYNIEYINTDKLTININILADVSIKLNVLANLDNISFDIKYTLNERSSLLVNKFYHNKRVDEKIVVNLDGKYAHIDYHFSGISVNHENYNIVINHNNTNTVSHIYNHLIAVYDNQVTLNINSVVPKGKVKSILDQDSRIISFGKNKGIIKPNMYIDEADVEARHGSIIGSFSEDKLFYLMSRGISKEDGVKLLVKGYIFSNIYADMDTRALILKIIDKYWR